MNQNQGNELMKPSVQRAGSTTYQFVGGNRPF